MHSATLDPLVQAARLAADYGIHLDPYALARNTAEAGALDRPDDTRTGLTPEGVAVCDLLLREVAIAIAGDAANAATALRIRMLAHIACLLLPPVICDYLGRFELHRDGHDRLPDAEYVWGTLCRYAAKLADYIDEHDAGEWVDPYAIAGAVADVHDTARLLETLFAHLGRKA